MRAFAPAALALSLLAPACESADPDPSSTDSDTGSTGAPDSTPDSTPHVTFVGRVDVVDLCGVIGANLVSFRARQVGCEPGPPAPCTLQTDPHREWFGEAATCPGGHTALDLRVDVPVRGRFEVEARTLTDSGFISLCYGVDGQVPTPVTAEQVEARAEVVVRATAGPCRG